ncbi:MAG: hypothetical protein AAFR76_03250 [Planctomycetota bacterium]
MTRTALALLVAGSAAAQPDMLITVDNVAGDEWTISAESFVFIDIIQLWADASFELIGDGSPITITSYNPSYDTLLGDAVVTNGPTASFLGVANNQFGIADPSNPLYVLDFEYAGAFDDVTLTLVGQNSGEFRAGGFSFLELYQDANGNPGSLTWDIRYVPTPATLALAPMVLVKARRRRSQP